MQYCLNSADRSLVSRVQSIGLDYFWPTQSPTHDFAGSLTRIKVAAVMLTAFRRRQGRNGQVPTRFASSGSSQYAVI